MGEAVHPFTLTISQQMDDLCNAQHTTSPKASVMEE